MTRLTTHRVCLFDRTQPFSLALGVSPWNLCESVEIASFHPRSSDHRPATRTRVFATPEAIHVHFHVKDRYVRSVATQYQDMVCRDSCVEFFWQPKDDGRYFNFEFNCGGAMLLYHIRDARGEELIYDEVAPEHAREIQILTTMPRATPVEITEPLEWQLAARIPFRALEPYMGPFAPTKGMSTRGNFYKCGSECSHPHWAAWAPTGENLNFHQPAKFGELVFA